MKKNLVFFLGALFSLLCLCCSDDGCRIEGFGEVYLSILDENGKPFSYEDAERFIIDFTNSYTKTCHPVIDEKDRLIFSLGNIRLKYHSCKRLKEKQGFTDNEIRNALDDSFCFSIKDKKKPSEYKTIANKPCNSCFVKFERTNVHPATYIPNNKSTHIYYCEIQLERK